ncbi:haloacid dehalogenase-like hydrolase family protein [Trichomonas vaginalis G3]|uniref:Haloacid dehalogenase-like hydrolase family protein n=1 Tax=Trichomonas vaginalis (strain ATCC PRA-98 / G3) TaxID=412133 RepID=A2EZW3_TRIV3|nr:pseudouridine 5'-phosphatase protein [Trichomonas vaginalis G3]EAY01826.1 haloacid dehalogenase-like hydrolase family protein [Trichomonas vaginalis G3]KAI5550373.1 pseudouridine 5'-phosphatase protein [Trichomonas vaginalis G3]|eukprot:XP_001314373.1 haloacid dehalogenase-like hydrolase family protein [Trichomonas vaginalis G3]
MLDGIEAVFFDMDGTILNSLMLPPMVDKKFFAAHGLEVPKDLTAKFYSMSFTQSMELFQSLGCKGTVKELYDQWISLAHKLYTEDAEVKPGAVDLMKLLRERNIKTAICTSNARELGEAIVKSKNLSEYIDTVFTSCEVEKAKPAPDVYLKAASYFNVDPAKCLVFEDSVSGIKSGLSAGMHVCAIYDTFSAKHDQEKRQLAHYYIQDFTHVLDGTYEKLK